MFRPAPISWATLWSAATLNGATFFGGGGNVPATPVLYLYGKLNDSLNLNAGGSLYYAGGSSPQVNYNGGGKHFTTLPNPIGYYTNPLISLSAQLSKLNASPALPSSTCALQF
jgi:hypothetical protein